jgi:anti-anti-sigma factor
MAATWSVHLEADRARRLVVAGELDLADEQTLTADVEQLLADDTTPVQLDFAGLEFIDSSGIRALLRLRVAHPDRVRVVAVSAPVMRVLLLAGISDAVGVAQDGTT